jgi:hypothetical protein
MGESNMKQVTVLMLVGMTYILSACGGNAVPSGEKSALSTTSNVGASISNSGNTPQVQQPPIQAGALKVTPFEITITGGTTQQLQVSGGRAPYTIRVLVGTGTVTADGMFTAPTRDELNYVQIQDADSKRVFATITTKAPVAALALNYAPAVAYDTDVITLTGTGGAPPYTYTKIAGAGTLSGNTFTPNAGAATNIFEVKDSKGTLVTKTVVVLETQAFVVYIDDGDYVYPSPGEGAKEAFRAFVGQASDRKALTRCEEAGKPNNWVLALGTICPDGRRVSKGAIAYVSNVQKPNTVALYWNGDFQYTMDKNSALQNNWQIAGYVPRAP